MHSLLYTATLLVARTLPCCVTKHSTLQATSWPCMAQCEMYRKYECTQPPELTWVHLKHAYFLTSVILTFLIQKNYMFSPQMKWQRIRN